MKIIQYYDLKSFPYHFSFLVMLANLHAGIIWTDVLLMDEVLHEAALPDYSLEVFL
jgi:hypothetical protein